MKKEGGEGSEPTYKGKDGRGGATSKGGGRQETGDGKGRGGQFPQSQCEYRINAGR